MKKLIGAALLAAALTGCATGMSPVTGTFYTNVTGALAATDNPEKPTKIGRSSARSILGVYAVGNASIEQAAKNAGITRIHHVDYETQSIMGVIADVTIVVYGN